MATPNQSRVLNFGLFEVDLEAGELRKSGMRQKLGGQPFEILRLLLERPREIVTREELRERIWPQDTFVDYDLALRKAIARLREVLGDSAESPRFIETIPRRGYRFIAAVELHHPLAPSSETPERRGAPADSPPGSRGDQGAVAQEAGSTRPREGRALPYKALAGILAGVVLAAGMALALNVAGLRGRVLRTVGAVQEPSSLQMQSIAVLPLENLSGDPTQEYFSDGMTDALITDLSQIGSLKVISRTSVMHYKKTDKTLPEIARELNVDGIVEGTVQRSGDHVRITAQLIQGPTDKHLWAKSYERDTGDVFVLERDLTQEIVRQIQARVTTPNQAPLAPPPPLNPKALDAYLQGNYHLRKGLMGARDKDFRTAGEYFQQAIDAAPNFALAYVGWAEAHHMLFWSSSEDFALMRRAAEKAVAIDPASSEARTELGFAKFDDWDWSGAEEEYRRAIALNPNNALAHERLGWLLDAVGRLEEGWREFELAQELDPNEDHLSAPLYRRGGYDPSIERLLKAIESRPKDAVAHYALSQDYALKGMYKEWVRELSRAVALMGFPESAGRVQQAFAVSGYPGARREEARELEHWAATKQDYSPCTLAEVYTSLGDKDRAFYWLGQGLDHRHMAMNDDLSWFKVVPELAPLRSDPRFKDMLRRAGLPP